MTAALIDALDGLAGVTIRVRHELPEASMRLMETIGVNVVIDPAAEPCVRFAKPHEHALREGGCRRCQAMDQSSR